MNRGRRIPQPLPEVLELKRGTKILRYTLSNVLGNQAQYLDEDCEYHFFNVQKLRVKLNLPEFIWENEKRTEDV